MAITLEEAKNNAVEDYTVDVIEEFQKFSPMLDVLEFDDAVNPAGGGGTWSYGYRREKTQRGAATRAINTDYTPEHITTEKHSTELAVMGGKFSVDRVVARNMGPGSSGAVAVQANALMKSTIAKFSDMVVNGDTGVDTNGFDGLGKILTGSSTEVNTDKVLDWSNLGADAQQATAHDAIDALDEFLDLLNGPATFVLGNAKALARVRSIARRAGMFVNDPIENLLDRNGRPIRRQQYGNITMIDAGEKAGSADLVIPTVTRTIDSSPVTGLTDLYAIRVDIADGFHGVATVGSSLIEAWLPTFDRDANAVQDGAIELGPVSVALKATRGAAVLRNIKVQ